MNITSISTYTAEDEARIEQAYIKEDGTVDYDAIAAAIISNDTTNGPIEDLLSFHLDRKGEVPGTILSSPEAVAYLWEDPTVVGTLQEWRRESPDMNSQMVTDLTTLLASGGADVSTIADADAFILENMANANTGGFDASKYDDVTNLVTNMVTIMMHFGNPGMALLAYVLGFDASVSEEDVEKDTAYSLQQTTAAEEAAETATEIAAGDELAPTDTEITNVDPAEVTTANASVDGDSTSVEASGESTTTEEALPGEYVAVDGEVVAEAGVVEGVETDGHFGTADEIEGAQVGYVKNSGLGDVVKDLQGTAIDVITDAQSAWEDVIAEIAAIPIDDPQEAAQLNAENNKRMEDIKKIITSMEEFIKMAQDILDSVIEAAGTLNEKQARVWSNIMR